MTKIGCSAVPWPSVCYSLIISLANKQTKGLGLILSVPFAFRICESVAVDSQK